MTQNGRNLTKRERVIRAARKLGPNARLHAIAFEARMGHRSAAAVLRGMKAQRRPAVAVYFGEDASGVGACSTYTLPPEVGYS